MEDDDEIDILGDFNLEDLLCKKDGRLSFYDGVQNLDISCDYSNVSSHWLLDSSTQSVWDDKQGEPRGQVLQGDSIPDSSGWTDKEKYLLEKGLELFGKSWARLAQYIGSKSATQVKFYVKNVMSPSGPTINELFTVWPDLDTPTGLLPSELIDDMEIPASMEEVITAVSTASPTINVPVSKTKISVRRKRRISNSSSSTTRPKRRRPKSNIKEIETTIPHEPEPEPEVIGRIITTVNDEEVVVLGRSEDEDSEIDVTEDEPHDSLKGLSNPSHSNVPQEVATTSSDSSLSYFSCDNTLPKDDNNLEHVPHTKSSSKQVDSLQLIYQLPDPVEEIKLDKEVISEEEENLFPEFFQKGTSMVLRYLKIRNHIINCWIENKPSYMAKTTARRTLKNCGDVNLISRIHFYLEKKGAINFGCSQCRYLIEPYGIDKPPSENIPKTSFSIIQTRKKRNRIHGSLMNFGGITMAHGDDGQVIQIIKEPLHPKPRKLSILQRRTPLPIQV